MFFSKKCRKSKDLKTKFDLKKIFSVSQRNVKPLSFSHVPRQLMRKCFLKEGLSMNEQFNKFKKKLMIEHGVKSALVGLIAGFLGSGISMFIFGFTGTKFIWWVHVLIGAALFLAFGIAFFFWKKPTDAKIAARMDRDMGLQEKIATMVEFQDESSLLIDKQREDAMENLSTKTTKNVPFKLAVFTLPILALSAAVFTSSFFAPKIAESTGIIDNGKKTDQPIENVDKATTDIIDDIHNQINKSDADDSLKDDLNKILDDLERELEGDDDVDSRKDKIDAAKDKMDEALDKANSKEEIGDALQDQDNDALKELGEAIVAGDEDKINEALEKLKEQLGELSGQEKADAMKEIADEINSALEKSEIPEGDALRDALKELADQFDEEAKKLEEELKKNEGSENQEAADQQASDSAQQGAESAIDQAGEKINQAVQQQKENEDAVNKAKEEMDQLENPKEEEDQFEKDEEEKDDQENDDQNNDDQNDDNQDSDDSQDSGDDSQQGGSQSGQQSGSQSGSSSSGSQSGSSSQGGQTGDGSGSGNGNTNFPSNDHVYTGGDDGDKKYSDVVDDYNADAKDDAKNNGDDSGDVDDYFDYLYGNGD